MANYILTNQAVQDLSDIWQYTFSEWSEEQADHYYNTLIGQCERLASNPNLGKHYSVISKSIFGFPAGRHIIFYRKQRSGGIEVVRFLHERMDLLQWLKQ